MPESIAQTYTRADEAFDCLQTAIVKGDLAPGEKIGEVELCSLERFDPVSQVGPTTNHMLFLRFLWPWFVNLPGRPNQILDQSVPWFVNQCLDLLCARIELLPHVQLPVINTLFHDQAHEADCIGSTEVILGNPNQTHAKQCMRTVT